jgi:uncharacterized repeat protein (TIGR03803 family)
MQPSSAAKLVSRIFLALLLAAAIMPTPARAQTFTVLHTFDGKDGAFPEGVLVRDAAGNLYGTTAFGGTGNCGTDRCGTAFMLNKTGKLVGSYSFGGANGMEPQAGLFRDAAGNFYGTTESGGDNEPSCGSSGCGTVFKLNPRGKETVIHKFTATPDGFFPQSLLIEDGAGNLYGTTQLGGDYALGAVFKIDMSGNETILYSFTGGSDGCFAAPGVILDSAGNLYGVASEGGLGFCNSGVGVVFKVDPSGNETVLHTFGGEDGANPDSVLLFDSETNLYGTTANGGTSEGCGFSGCGTVFELSPQQNGSWSETVLYSFCSLSECADGEEPVGPLVRDVSGNLYGATYFGGGRSGDGIVFKLDTSGNETVLHSFAGGSGGAGPAGGLVMDNAGSLYGTTQEGGDACAPKFTCGVVFEITP